MTEFIPLVQKFCTEHMAGKINILEMFKGQSRVIPEIFRSVYQLLLNGHELTPIEDLPRPEKERLFKLSQSINKTDKEHTIVICKSLYLIEQLTDTKLV